MRGWQWGLLAGLGVAGIVLAYLDDPHHFPAFYAVFAVVGALLFVGLAKLVLKKLLMRKEDYYDES